MIHNIYLKLITIFSLGYNFFDINMFLCWVQIFLFPNQFFVAHCLSIYHYRNEYNLKTT